VKGKDMEIKSCIIKKGFFLRVILLLIISGCAGSEPSRFYTLDVSDKPEHVRSSSSYKLSVAIGPVVIPDYLDRPQIVSRTGKNEITFSEFDRWAGSLRDDIARVLSENLTILLSENDASVSPWEWGTPGDYRVAVEIRRFDIMPEGDVLMNVRWTILSKDGIKIILMRESTVSEPVSGQTYRAKVSSMSRALERLSLDIAEGIQAVTRKSR
jgi:uncharacterized protein